MGRKGKKRGQIGKISASAASRAVAWGGKRAGGQTTSRLSSMASNAEPGPRLGFCWYYFLGKVKYELAFLLFSLGQAEGISCKR